MSADEFIEQYGRIEILKMMKANGDTEGVEEMMSRGSLKRENSNGRVKSANYIGMGDMKLMLRDSMNRNLTTYGQLDTSADQHHSHGRGPYTK